MLADYRESGLMSSDFMALEPKDRLVIAERLMQYYMPKMQATTVDLTASERQATIIDRLADLAGEDE